MSNHQVGHDVEVRVAEYLRTQEYKIREINWNTKFAEIDIVAEKDGALCFIEVKYRKTLTAGDGFDYITPTKLHHMRRAAESYVLAHGWTAEYIMLAVSATGELDSLQIELVEV